MVLDKDRKCIVHNETMIKEQIAMEDEMDNKDDLEEFIPETDSPILEIRDDGEQSEPENEPEEMQEELPELDLSFDFEEEEPEKDDIDDEMLASISSNLASQVKGEYVQEEEEQVRRMPVGLIVAGSIVIGLLLLMFFFIGTDSGRKILLDTSFGKYLISSVGGEVFEENVTYAPGTLTPEPTTDPGLTMTPEPTPDAVLTITPEPTDDPALTVTPEPTITEAVQVPQTIFHFLLLGLEDEAQAEGSKKTDLLMLATLDTKNGELYLTTILRDLLVQIPGAQDNIISSVYSDGGITLLYDTLEKNLGIRPDGYLMVEYAGFRDIIDLMGGVNVELTAKEAAYLNKTNYISLPENRTVTEGENHLNGDQALGYCRIRHVETKNKEYSDIGRTTRQRELLYSLYGQLREQSATDAYKLLKKCLSYVTTDITGDDCTTYLEAILNMSSVNFTQHRIPMDDTYQTNVVRKMSVLVADMKYNREVLLQMIYPEGEMSQTNENAGTEPEKTEGITD